MELFLNIVWFAVSVALTAFLCRHQSCRAVQLRWGVVLSVVLFIVVLLFPAISASDDLYNETMLSEDLARRSHSLLCTHLDTAPAMLVTILFAAFFFSGLRYSGHLVESATLIALPSSFRPSAGLRAPPSALPA